MPATRRIMAALTGRVSAMAADLPASADAEFTLLLCTRVPCSGERRARADNSAAVLLRQVPPAELWSEPPTVPVRVNGRGMMTNQYGALEPVTLGGRIAQADPMAGPGGAVARSYKLPYDLLITPEEARLVMAGMPPRTLSSDPREAEAPAVCSAHIRLPRRRKGRDGDEWDAHWRKKVGEFAGQWARVTVEAQRYSFTAHQPHKPAEQRIGTRLVLKNIEPAGAI